jgi:acyl-CoA thioesterase-1
MPLKRAARLSVVLAIVMAAGSACHAGTSSAAPSAVVPRDIVAFGDSLTAGYGIEPSRAFPALLQEYLRRERLPFTMINAGASGDTSSSALARLTGVLARKPAIVIVALGANDGLRGVPVARMRQNLSHIVRETKASGARVILCGMEALPLYGWSYTLDFHNAFVALAREHDVPLVPFFMASVVGRDDLLLGDRLHPNAAGARFIADTIWPYLEAVVRSTAA